MKSKENKQRPPLSSSIVEDDATEGLKKRLQDLGLIVNAGVGKSARPAAKKKGGKEGGRK